VFEPNNILDTSFVTSNLAASKEMLDSIGLFIIKGKAIPVPGHGGP
jgi:hypothetical protein